jgi:flagellar assembly protein FliH
MVRREGVQAAVREVMRGVHERERLVVRVSPRDHALLAVDGFKPRNGDGQAVELLADERVELGGCLIETGGGTLDGRLETQLKRLRDTLVGAARASVVEGAS